MYRPGSSLSKAKSNKSNNITGLALRTENKLP